MRWVFLCQDKRDSIFQVRLRIEGSATYQSARCLRLDFLRELSAERPGARDFDREEHRPSTTKEYRRNSGKFHRAPRKFQRWCLPRNERRVPPPTNCPTAWECCPRILLRQKRSVCDRHHDKEP